MSKFSVIMETSGEECESWYYFVKYDGNEKALEHLKTQLESVEQSAAYSDISVFDVEIDNLVSEQTVDEMVLLELNSVMYHRKFVGSMKMIDFGFKSKHKDTRKLAKIDEKLSNGLIDNFLGEEFIPETHRLTGNEVYSSDEMSESSDDDSGSDSDEISDLDEKLPSSLKI